MSAEFDFEIELETIEVEFADGEKEECEVLEIFEVGEKVYIALAPLADGENADVYIYEYNELSEEEFELNDITDEEEFENVAQALDKILAEDEV